MRVDRIALNGWRNYAWESVTFSGDTNVITGPNAQGKTNLLEAIYMLSTGRSFRTRFDREIVGFDFSSAELLGEFNRLYEHKTRILKDWREKPSLLDTLDEFSDALCRVSAQLIRYRAAFTARLDEAAAPIHKEFSGEGEELSLRYATVSTVTDPFAPARDIYYQICDHQERHRQAEIDSQQCLTGAHKDDLEIFINGRSARSFASQGQTRTAALSVKLAEREIFLAETGEYPILLLDDVLSELDDARQSFVLNRIGGGQTLITCCEDENISSRTGGKVLFVEKGRIR